MNDKNTGNKTRKRINWLQRLRMAAVVISFVASLLGLGKVALEFTSALEQRTEPHHKP